LASADFKPAASVGYLKENLTALRGIDTWILSRLSECVELYEQGLKNYELTATTALFNFWLYDLYDYYI
jgi:valyl-tRNA synthetase